MFVKVNGNLLHTIDVGPRGGRTILGHDGWVADWEVWHQPYEVLSHKWRCVAYDHRGAGESAVHPDQIIWEGLIDDVFGVMDVLGIDRCIGAGESLRAGVIVDAYMRHPDRFEGLVLVGGAARVRPAQPVANPESAPAVVKVRADFHGYVRDFVDAGIPEADSDHLRRWGRHIIERSDGESGARMFMAAARCELPSPDVTQIKVPTLLIHGSRDAIVPLAAAERMAASIPNSRLVVLDGAGHVPPITRPEEVIKAIEEMFG
jgi:pimeloyl-ACP methyl ester carboxylesterase